MKRKSSRDRAIPLSPGLPGAMGDRHLNSVSPPSASRQRDGNAKKIFVIRQTKVLRAADGSCKKIRRVLIFDNHPNSLRLVYGGRASQLSNSQPVSSSGVALIWILVLGLMTAMFWPIL
jgi:hypothetical protein